MKRILIIGCGDVGERLVRRYRGQAHFFALTRSETGKARLRMLGIVPVVGDLDHPNTLKRLPTVDGVFHFAPPPAEGSVDTRTRHLLRSLAQNGNPARLVYISTSGVYGDCGGDWVDESRATAPVNGRAIRRVDAENQLRSWGARQHVRVSILRAPGIYAADRLPLERIKRGSPALIAVDDSYTNHIHADDLARLAWIAMFRGRPQRIYHAVDAQPMKMGDWFDSCADAFGLARSPRVTREEAEGLLSEALLSFLRESRRLSNLRVTSELRFRYAYPTSDHMLKQITQAQAGLIK